MKITLQYLKKRIATITPKQAFILLGVASVILFSIKYFGLKKEWRTIKIEVVGRDWVNSFDQYGYKTPYWLSEKLAIGQIEKNSRGKTIAEVIDIENYRRGGEEAEVYLTVKVRAELNKKMSKYVFKGQALDLGTPIELRLSNIYVPGQIIDENIPEKGYEQKEFIITGKWYGQEKWAIDRLSTGDKMTNRSNGEVIAEIVEIETQPTTTNMFSSIAETSGKQVYIESNPNRKDVLLSIRLKAEKHDGDWYFAGHQIVKPNNELWLYTDEINISELEIQQVKEYKSNDDKNRL